MNNLHVGELPRDFLRRRNQNWVFLGLMYASYYMCRYNFPIANKTISERFGFSREEMGWIIAATMWAYAFGQLLNGLIADKIGGRKAILTGAVGTIVLNILMGLGGYFNSLTYFMLIWGLNGYFQAFGAPSVVKVNASWFRISERGTFTGIFGLMIQFGRWAIMLLGGILIVRFSWEYLFFIPSMITFLFAILAYLKVRDTPEECGYNCISSDKNECEEVKSVDVFMVLKKVLKSKPLWIISFAYFCTGVVRHGVDQWYIRYLKEVHQISTDSFGYMLTAFGLPIAAVLGSFAAGLSSDKLFGSRRAPAAALMYLGQFVMLIIFALFSGELLSPILIVLMQFFINGPHSLLGGAAAMDFGGRKAAGFASGLIDCWQYIGAGLVAGIFMGRIIESFGYSGWIVTLVVFAFLGFVCMLSLWNKRA
ncbi:MAG: MFS transporter [Deltaproteobacteria bacterium]|nr:MFS transporter [Deltaproteobacteria bacterium]